MENVYMGDGSNAQENTYIVHSHLIGMNITAHGGKIINSEIGQKTFVGFNSFLFGKKDGSLKIGKGCIVMPHTIIDIERPLQIPDDYIIWGYITCEEDLKNNMIAIDKLYSLDGKYTIGEIKFFGNGKIFINEFRRRIEQILAANGAYCSHNEDCRGHA